MMLSLQCFRKQNVRSMLLCEFDKEKRKLSRSQAGAVSTLRSVKTEKKNT